MSLMERIGLIDLSKIKWSGSRRLLTVVVIAVVAVAALSVRLLAFGGSSNDVISATAQRQDFVASVVERGVLKASQTVTYSAPRLRHGGGQQIVEIAPEGTLVKPGDMIVRFDDAALKDAVRQQQNSVDQSRAELRKIMAQQESQMASLQASLELSQHSHEQAKLNLSKLEFASEVQKRQEELSFQKSTLSLQKAEESIESQKRQNAAGLTRTQVRLQRQESDLKEMQQELTQSAIFAEQPGLVSYEMTYSTSGRTKVKLGDTPYPGQAIISIPDLTTMIVEVEISELDIRRVAKGQRALVRVDAYPDTVYSATVTELSPLARRVGTSQMKVFDCTVKIEGTDLSLRPGMTAQVMIVSRYVPDALVVPLDAVFLKEGKAIVYELDGGIHEIPVEVGENNGNYVVIKSGLAEGTRVALRDPYVPLKSLQTAGADALRQQRQASASSGGGETMFFMPGMMGGGGGGGRSGGFSGGGSDRGGRGGRGGF